MDQTYSKVYVAVTGTHAHLAGKRLSAVHLWWNNEQRSTYSNTEPKGRATYALALHGYPVLASLLLLF